MAMTVCGVSVLASACTITVTPPAPAGAGSPQPGATRQPDRTALSTELRSVRLRDMEGSVVLRVGERPRLERIVRASGPPPDRTYQIDGDTLVLSGCGRDIANCHVEYRVVVPRSTQVSGTASGMVELTGTSDVNIDSITGRFLLDDIAGSVSVASGTGEVTMQRVAGNVDLRLDSTKLRATGLAGRDVRVRADTGRIALGLTDPRTVHATAETGEVDLTVPRRSYRVNASVRTGRQDISVPRSRTARDRITVGAETGTVSVHS